MKNQKAQLDQAVKILQQGGVIAYPTEAVYGLGCDPNNISAIKKILALKQRNKSKGLILIASSFAQLEEFIQPLDIKIKNKLFDSWQNPKKAMTWLVPVKQDTSEYLKGQFDTLAVRVSHHPVVQALCDKFNGAIVSTSANLAGEEAARTSEEVKQIFTGSVDMVVAGETNIDAQPSEIRDALSDKVIRKS